MSRAFVREPDGDEVRDDLPDKPQSAHPNYVTPGGLTALQAMRDRLRAEKEALETHKDDMETKQALPHVQRDLRWVLERIERAILVDLAVQPRDKVAFGAEVEIIGEDDKRRTYRVVGEDEADAANGLVSWVSPLARALDAAAVGDVVLWKRPAGEVELEVAAIRYPEK
ncbi:MAG: transcription elongation factor GreAB [Rhodospirillaceae bacterium]|jgi:transcription elongation factor GreB|nr:transcription elongation factor GreAB [Rhodospirillaceae bacterium]MBT6118216.1 transcription elongation factor GreAB [Rhodospirillaceae bacterium]